MIRDWLKGVLCTSASYLHLAGHGCALAGKVHMKSEVIVSFQRLGMMDKIGDVHRYSSQHNEAQARTCS